MSHSAYVKWQKSTKSDRSGFFAPHAQAVKALGPGEVGFLTAGIKEVREARVGGHDYGSPTSYGSHVCRALRPQKPMVFQRPVSGRIETLRGTTRRGRKTSSQRCRFFRTRKKTSLALGFGFRCGFLGLLHMENRPGAFWSESSALTSFTTTPTVEYQVLTLDGENHARRESVLSPAGTGNRFHPRAFLSWRVFMCPKNTSAMSCGSVRSDAEKQRAMKYLGGFARRPWSMSCRSMRLWLISMTGSNRSGRGYALV